MLNSPPSCLRKVKLNSYVDNVCASMSVFIKADSNAHLTLRFLDQAANTFFHLSCAIALKINLRRDSSCLHDNDWSPVPSYTLPFRKDFKIEIILYRSLSVTPLVYESPRNTSWQWETNRKSILPRLEPLRALKDCKLSGDCLLLICEMNCSSMFSGTSLLCPMYKFKPIYNCINCEFGTRVIYSQIQEASELFTFKPVSFIRNKLSSRSILKEISFRNTQ